MSAARRPGPRAMPDTQALRRKSRELSHVAVNLFEGLKEVDLEAIAKQYEENKDPDALAGKYGISAELLRYSPPESAMAFAKAMYDGRYTADKTEEAKAKLRERLLQGVQSARGSLKHSTTKELLGPSEADIKAVAEVYTYNSGVLGTISREHGINEQLMRINAPKDARTFAIQLLTGMYTYEDDMKAKADWRRSLSRDIPRAAIRLKGEHETRRGRALTEDDMSSFVRVYEESKGDPDVLAKKVGVDPEVVKRLLPEDAEDFARKILEGMYSVDQIEACKHDFREQLKDMILKKVDDLKSAVPRKLTQVGDRDIDMFEKFYDDNDGDLEAIAKATGIPYDALQDCPPQDASDFADKLMAGMYSKDMDAVAREKLRKSLRGELMIKTKSLKHTTTKEWDGQAASDQIEKYAKIWREEDGELFRIAKICSLDLEKLKQYKPADGEEFAKNFLLGRYQLAES